MSMIAASPPVWNAKVAIAVNIAKKAGAVDEPQSADWRGYPFELVGGDPPLRLPAAEGNHLDCESDTWFIAGELTADSGRRFAFLTIFNKNRPGLGAIVAAFYTFALFDLDTGNYGTYTAYDMPPANTRPGARPKMFTDTGHLDLTYDSDAGHVVWRTCRDERRLMPYT